MSLTKPYGVTEKKIKAIIKNISPNKEQFYLTDGLKCFNVRKECMVPYELESTYQSALCGTAFDYLARFLVARIAEHNRENSLTGMVAERFITSSTNLYTIEVDEKIKEKLVNKKHFFTLPKDIVCGNVHSYAYISQFFDVSKEELQKFISQDLIKIRCVSNYKKVLKFLKDGYNNLLKPIREYIHGDYIGDEILIDVSIVLAKMEHMKRSGVGAVQISRLFDYDTENQCVKNELFKMIKSFRNVFIPLVSSDSVVVYNPHFGIGSRMVGGADADIYLDGVIYDFKTTIKNGWSSVDAIQITGYYLLDAVSKKIEDKRNDLFQYPIEKIALYKVRYEEIAYFDVKEIQENVIINAVRDLCYVYLMYNLNLFIPHDNANNYLERFRIPLTKKEILNYCSNNSAEELEWYIKSEEISDFGKERMKKIIDSFNVLKVYLDSLDVTMLFKELVGEYNMNIIK